MIEVDINDAGLIARLEHGSVDPNRVTLFSTMKNEMGFLPAWLDHHRKLGFEQFLIWDDASDDGTYEYLRRQTDCAVMRSGLRFGQKVSYTDPDGVVTEERVGTYLKIAIPHLYFNGQFVAYVDADEFLILPPKVTSIQQVIERLKAEGAPSCVASVVEFFPRDAQGLEGDIPRSFEGLIAAYPHFQPETLVHLREGQQPEILGQSKTARLFAKYDVKPRVIRKGLQRIWMSTKAKKAQTFQKSPRHKTPLVRRDAQSRLTGSHYANLPPSPDVLLCVAHFVFNAGFAKKIEAARSWGGHANGAVKYRYYGELLEKLKGVKDGFLDEESVTYHGPEQLVLAGLIRW